MITSQSSMAVIIGNRWPRKRKKSFLKSEFAKNVGGFVKLLQHTKGKATQSDWDEINNKVKKLIDDKNN